MPRNKIEYKELSKARVTDSRNLVISTCSKGGYTIAQQLEAKEDNDKTTTVFLKGAFHIDDTHGLYNIRDAINLAIKYSEESDRDNGNDEEWD